MTGTYNVVPEEDNGRFSRMVEPEVLRTFLGLMQKHFDRSDGQLVPIGIDPNKNPWQRYAIIGGNREGNGPEVVDAMAPHAISNYGNVVGELITNPKNRQAIDQTEKILGNNGNVWLVVGHEIITDPGIALVGLHRVLLERRVKYMSSIVISKGVSVAGFKFGENAVPAAEALRLMCDRLYMPIPDSTSVHRAGLRTPMYRSQVKRYNGSILQDIDLMQRQGGHLTVVAPTAAAAQPTAESEGKMVMPTVKTNTARLLTREDGWVLPVAVGQNKDKSWFMKFLSEPVKLESESEVHDMMDEIAALQSELSYRSFIYDHGQSS